MKRKRGKNTKRLEFSTKKKRKKNKSKDSNSNVNVHIKKYSDMNENDKIIYNELIKKKFKSLKSNYNNTIINPKYIYCNEGYKCILFIPKHKDILLLYILINQECVYFTNSKSNNNNNNKNTKMNYLMKLMKSCETSFIGILTLPKLMKGIITFTLVHSINGKFNFKLISKHLMENIKKGKYIQTIETKKYNVSLFDQIHFYIPKLKQGSTNLLTINNYKKKIQNELNYTLDFQSVFFIQ